MGRIAVFIDAGYFWVQAVHIIHGRKLGRESIAVNYPSMRSEFLDEIKAQFPDSSLLRIYWYDGPALYGKADSHTAVEALDDFKLRLGTRTGKGDQKAVDGLIIADLISLAQSKSISSAIVVSGDADLTPGVQAAQGLGIRVHLLSLGPVNATSPFLKAEVDQKKQWDDSTVKKFIAAKPIVAAVSAISGTAVSAAISGAAVSSSVPATPVSAPVTGGSAVPAAVSQPNPLEAAATLFLASLGTTEKKALSKTAPFPKPLDARLLTEARRKLGRSLTDQEKPILRAALRKLL